MNAVATAVATAVANAVAIAVNAVTIINATVAFTETDFAEILLMI